MALMDLVLLRAGAETVAAFQARAGLPPTGVADGPTWQQALPYLTGYRLHRLKPGDTYTALAQRYGTTVSAIAGANPNQDPRALMVDQYLTVPLGFDVVPEDQPFTWALTRLILEGLRARYPFLLLSELTRTRYGRSLFQITVGNGRQKRLFNAAHHANEWITTLLLLRFAEELAAFEQAHAWVRDYATFYAIKAHFGYISWMEWPDQDIRLRKPRARAKYRGRRNAKRIIFSSDGLIFYTEDHYTTFEEIVFDD